MPSRQVTIPQRDGKPAVRLTAQWNTSTSAEHLGRQIVLQLLERGHVNAALAFMPCPARLGGLVQGLPRTTRVPKAIDTTPATRVDKLAPGHSLRVITDWTSDGVPRIIETFNG